MRGIVANPALHAEAKALIPALTARLAGGGEEAVGDVVGRRLATFPQSDRSEAEWAAWWADYVEACGDQPHEALEAGMRKWVRTDTTGYMPKPGQLRALALEAAGPHWQALSRAKRAAALDPPRFTGPKADPAEVQALLDQLGAKRATHEGTDQ